MRYLAKVIYINPNIEEDVTLDINGSHITGFVRFCPYKIEIGKAYPVCFSACNLDDFHLKELRQPEKSLINIDTGFAHIIRGQLNHGYIDAGVIIEADFLEEYEYLNGQYIEIFADRLEIKFLR